MAETLSVAEVMDRLEKRAAFHREREGFHAAHEQEHRVQKETHSAELAKVAASLEAFRSAAIQAQELAAHAAAQLQQEAGAELPIRLSDSGRPMISRAVRAVVEGWTGPEPFGAAQVAVEINRRAQGRLRRPVTARSVADALRRLAQEGLLQVVRQGGPYHGAAFARARRTAG